MARQRAKLEIEHGAAPSPDEHTGKGGSYVNNEDGTRTLVERTEDKPIRSAEEANRPKDEGTAESGATE